MIFNWRIYGLTCFLAGFSVCFAIGQQNLKNHARFSSASALDEERIHDITEDNLGFVWIGATNGTFRFDGVHLKHYFNGNTRRCIHLADQDQLIFIHTRGITRYWYLEDRSELIRLGDFSVMPNNIHNGSVFNDSTILLATQKGLGICHIASGQIEFEALQDEGGSPYILTAVVPDDQQDSVLWLGTSRKGLIRYDWGAKTQQVHTFDIEEENLQEGINIITAIYPSGNRLILGTWFAGFLDWSKEDQSYDQYFIQDKKLNDGILSLDRVLDILPINESRVWVSSTKGAAVYDFEEEKIVYRENNGNNARIFEHPPMYIDTENRIWMGRDDGLRLVDTLKKQFQVIENPYFDGELWEIPQKVIADPERNMLYFCNLVSDGLYAYDLETEKWQIIPPVSRPSYSVMKGRDIQLHRDTLWYLEESGLYFLPPDKPMLRRWNDQIAGGPGNFTHFTRMPDGSFILLSSFNGLFRTNGYQGALTPYTMPFNGEIAEALKNRGDFVHCDMDGNLWGCWREFVIVQLKGDTTLNLAPSFRDGKIIENVQDIFETEQYLWFALQYGVYRVDKRALPEILVEKVSDRNFIEIVVDESNEIWGVTPWGDFFRSRGVSSKDESWQASDGTHDPGRYGFEQIDMIGPDVVVGSRGAYSLFSPGAVIKNTELPEAFVEGVYINGLQYEVDTNLFLKKSLNLKSKENNIRFDFSAIGFTKPESIRFRYRLTDLEENWTETGIQNTSVVYTLLTGGDYTFQIMSSNDNENWTTPRAYRVHISTPFFRRKSTWVALTAILVALGLYFNRKRIRDMKKEAMLNMRLLTLEKQALRAQMNPHFVFNALTSIQHLITEDKEEKAILYLNKFSKLLRGVLHNSRRSTTRFSTELELLENYLQLEFLRLGDQYTYALIVDESIQSDDIEIQALLFQPFIENAIHHGLAHNKEGGHLKIEIRDKGDHLFCVIEDNGIGRERSAVINRGRKKDSVGMDLARERMAILTHRDVDDLIRIIDLYDGEEPAGTRVELKIPMKMQVS